MNQIKTPTRRMRIWSFNLENALSSLKAGQPSEYAMGILEDIIRQMEGGEAK